MTTDDNSVEFCDSDLLCQIPREAGDVSASDFDEEEEHRKRREKIARAEYDIGYGKPPIETRFGRGGQNPSRGRLRGSKNRPKTTPHITGFLDDVLRHSQALIRVSDQNGSRLAARIEVALSSVFSAAAGKNIQAAKLYFNVCERAEKQRRDDIEIAFNTVTEYKREWQELLQRHRREDMEGPLPSPHPDYVSIDPKSGLIRISGPSNEEEQLFWAKMLDEKDNLRSLIEELETKLSDPAYDSVRPFCIQKLETTRRRIALLDWWFAEYDGGPRCPHGHTPDEILDAIEHFGLSLEEPVVRG